MRSFSKHKLIIGLILLITLLVNAALWLLNKQQTNDIESLNKVWNDNVSVAIDTALTLNQLERSFGYVGFIHHFKNYIIRRDERYYQLAMKTHHQALLAIKTLKQSLTTEANQQDIRIIEKTINDYFNLLVQAKTKWRTFSVEQLDARVKVNDRDASKALIGLRERLLPNVMQQYNIAIDKSQQITLHAITTYVITLLSVGVFAIFLIILLFKREHLLKQLSTVLNSSPDGIIYAAPDGEIITANPAAHEIFRYRDKELFSKKIEDLMEPNLRERHCHYREHFTSKPQSRSMGGALTDILGVTKTGERISLDIAISSVEINNKNHSIAIVRDITEHKKLELQAQKDYLTELYNRRSIDLRIQEELLRAVRYGRDVSLIIVDIDNFKALNDIQGHLVGDQALKDVASFLLDLSRLSDHIGRWGGDEFIIVCPELAYGDAEVHAKRICREFAEFGGSWQPALTLSLGVTSFHGANSIISAETFFKQADAALFEAKQLGRNQVKCFCESEHF